MQRDLHRGRGEHISAAGRGEEGGEEGREEGGGRGAEELGKSVSGELIACGSGGGCGECAETKRTHHLSL
jgi:hypothetical protein